MIGLILAGGRGTRLRPHTEEIPKPLLDINGKAILGYQLDTLIKLGISPIVIVTGFLSYKIEEYVTSNYPDHHFIFAHNAQFEHSRPAFGIITALPHLNDDVIYLNGDVIYDSRILSSIVNSSFESATAIQRVPWDEEEVNVITNEEKSIIHISKNIPEHESHGEFIGVTKLSKSFVDEIKRIIEKEGSEAFRYSFAVDLLNHAINIRNQPLYAFDVTEFEAIEIDTPEDYNEAIKKQAHIKQSEHERLS